MGQDAGSLQRSKIGGIYDFVMIESVTLPLMRETRIMDTARVMWRVETPHCGLFRAALAGTGRAVSRMSAK